MTTMEMLESAVAYHRRGHWTAAEELYRRVLAAEPLQFDALHLLGVVLHQTGRSSAAIELLRRALDLRPDSAEAYFNLGNVLRQTKDIRGSVDCYRRAIQHREDYPEAHYNLGNSLRDLGESQAAIASFETAVQLRPDDASAHYNLGRLQLKLGNTAAALVPLEEAARLNPLDPKTQAGLADALRQAGRLAEAIATCRSALETDPGNDDALVCLGASLLDYGQYQEALSAFDQALLTRSGDAAVQGNRGVVLLRMRRSGEAIASLEKALKIDPNNVDVLINLGVALLDADRSSESLAALDRALELRPGDPVAMNNRAAALLKVGRLEESIACCHAALAHDPNNAEALNNLAISLLQQLKFDEALAALRQAVDCRPDYAEPHAHRACIWLQLGDEERGWPEYEWRWKCKALVERKFNQPRWHGENLKGKTILLYAEQGLGDTLQFIRLAPLVKERGGRVIVECPDRLIPILSRCQGIDQLVAMGQPLPGFDVQAPLLSLPLALGVRLAVHVGAAPYLFADDKLVADWRARFAQDFPGKAFRIGINWSGKLSFRDNPYQYRAIELANFAALARDGVQLISLQAGDAQAQIAELSGRFEVAQLGDDLDKSAGPFMDTAAIMKNLDLVVTCDTSIAHLAGGLGVPTWVALPYSCDFRWGVSRADVPWYPRMRLFRQSEPGNWKGVFVAMAERLDQLFRQRKSTKKSAEPAAAQTIESISVPVAPGELIDKLTILAIKLEQISDPKKLEHVRTEHALLSAEKDKHIRPTSELNRLEAELKRVNGKLWVIEEEIRVCERKKDFGPKFVELARSVYQTNDQRALLKRKINDLLGSAIIEEKDYKTRG